MKLLEGKTALITGAARGIGKALALRFAQEGANIAFTDLTIDENGKATEAEIAACGVKCKGYASNAADFNQTKEVVAQVVEDFGRIDILVNNAGITKDGLMMRMTEAQWDAVIAVNLKSAFNFINAVLPIMVRQRGGSIINMASVVGVHGNAGQANYAASKAGLIALAKSIAQEVGSRGIRANAIAPGFIETAMTAQLPDAVREEWKKKIPLRRGGSVDDIANVATFLASDMFELRHRPGHSGRRRHEYVITGTSPYSTPAPEHRRGRVMCNQGSESVGVLVADLGRYARGGCALARNIFGRGNNLDVEHNYRHSRLLVDGIERTFHLEYMCAQRSFVGSGDGEAVGRLNVAAKVVVVPVIVGGSDEGALALILVHNLDVGDFHRFALHHIEGAVDVDSVFEGEVEIDVGEILVVVARRKSQRRHEK